MDLGTLKSAVYPQFITYVNHAMQVLQRGGYALLETGLRYIPFKDMPSSFQLRFLAREAEDSSQFKDLIAILNKTLRKRSRIGIMYEYGVRSFFKRSGTYLAAFKGETLSQDDLFELYCSSLLNRKVTIRKMRLLDRVSFFSNEIKFPHFKIQRFSKTELDILTGQEINEIFYPKASLNTALAGQYWYIVEESSSYHGENVQSKSAQTRLWPPLSNVKAIVPDRPVQLLALHEWTPGWMKQQVERAWMGFRVPFSLRVNDDLFEPPPSVPPLPELQQRRPIILGEDLYESFVYLNPEQENELKAIVEKGNQVLELLSKITVDWKFVEIAMGYLGKAFLTDEGSDQILWHIATLEALLGNKSDDGIMEVLRRRIANIFGTTEAEKQEIRKKFNQLYKFRSSLVHGDSFSRTTELRHLTEAREMAKNVLLWFIDYLLWVDEHLRERVTYDRYPQRSELLSLLDYGRSSVDRLKLLIENLPDDFPRLQK